MAVKASGKWQKYLKIQQSIKYQILNLESNSVQHSYRSVSRPVFGGFQLTQILMNFKTSCCNSKIRGLAKNLVRLLFWFPFWDIFHFKQNCARFFMWKDVIENNSWYKRSLQIFVDGFIVIYDYYKGTFILLWKNISYQIWCLTKFKLGKFQTYFFGGGDTLISEYFESKFLLFYWPIQCSCSFKKMKPFLPKGFYESQEG